METLASRKQQFSDLRHEWKSKKQSLMAMDSRCCKLDDDEEDLMGGFRVSSLSSCYSSEVLDNDDGEVWRGSKGSSYLEQRFIELEQEWNSLKNSIPATRFAARISPTRPIFSPIKFQGRRLFEGSDSYSDSESESSKHHDVTVSSTSSRVSDLHGGEFEFGACSGLSDIHVNDGCKVMGTGRWRVVMMACVMIGLIMFALGFVSVACDQLQHRSDEFLVPT